MLLLFKSEKCHHLIIHCKTLLIRCSKRSFIFFSYFSTFSSWRKRKSFLLFLLFFFFFFISIFLYLHLLIRQYFKIFLFLFCAFFFYCSFHASVYFCTFLFKYMVFLLVHFNQLCQIMNIRENPFSFMLFTPYP